MPPHAEQIDDYIASRGDTRRVRVWDIGVRAFHWLLVASVVAALATGLAMAPAYFDAHLIAGTSVALLLLFRVVWGVLGSTYARFTSFVTTPLEAIAHARQLIRGEAPHHIGHNPLGAAMIVTLLALLTALVVTGVIVLGGVFKEGPSAHIFAYATGRGAKDVHELLAYVLLGLVGLHVLGIVIESVRTRDNLVRAMATGRKHLQHGSVTAPAAAARPLLAALVTSVIAVSSAGAIAHIATLPVPATPRDAMPQLYLKECKACHSAHHPSIAPASTWTAIMARLDDHFGDNASLDAPLAAEIAAYLLRNAADHMDTKPAHVLRNEDSNAPVLQLSATDGWKRIHRAIDAKVFERKTVGGRANCTNCHADAESGRFAPRAITIPEETIEQ